MVPGTAPRLEFAACPPGFRQLRPALISPLLRPRRRVVVPRPMPALAIPPLPVRVPRPSLALRVRAALFHAAGLGAAPCGAERP